MEITDLPEEILVDIIKKLDFKSVYNLYETCDYFKNIICMYNVVKTADLALSPMATVHFFKQCFMKDIAGHLHNLDLRGVVDLNKTSLLGAVARMKRLKTLDVSYTNITLFDLFEVYKMCPTIKNIACNFVFSKKKNVNPNLIIECQNLFKNFHKVHFVGNAGNLFYSDLAMLVLRKAHLSQLQLTIVENCGTVYQQFMDEEIERDINVNFKLISIYILNEWKIPNSYSGTIFILPSILQKKEKYECIAIIEDNCNKNQIYVTSIFKKFFECYNAKGVEAINLYKHIINGVIMLWDKAETVFDDIFFKELKIKLSSFFPYNIKDDSIAVHEKVDKFFFSVPSHDTRSNDSTDVLTFKKKRLASENYNLNFDTVFSNHKEAHLILFFSCNTSCPVALSPNSQYLKTLRSLYLTGYIRCSPEFFNVLFRCCEQLETLNVEDSPYSPNATTIARIVPLSSSLKNLRLVDRKIDFDMLFASLSQCSTLENIHIVDLSQDNNDLGDPKTLFEKCTKLCCICIFASMSTTTKTRRNQLFKNLKNKYGRWYMRLELCTSFADTKYNYDPYVAMFNVNPIKPIEQLY